MTAQVKNDIKLKISKGLELNYKRLVEEKQAKNQSFVVMRNNRIEYVKI
ncbi:MAG: hypothetical protein LBN95_02830 [Prevotellaceae bacterium]|jgi:hypothetical protein|nr:hypothetical protein [Prevotellaceae bacterium]